MSNDLENSDDDDGSLESYREKYSASPMGAEDLKRIDEALNILREHFDTAHIFVTRHEEGEMNSTIAREKGFGNWYARFGHINVWLSELG